LQNSAVKMFVSQKDVFLKIINQIFRKSFVDAGFCKNNSPLLAFKLMVKLRCSNYVKASMTLRGDHCTVIGKLYMFACPGFKSPDFVSFVYEFISNWIFFCTYKGYLPILAV